MTSLIKIKIQQTPNPNARKFITSMDLKREGKISYTDEHECAHVPLAAALLRLANVTQVHLFENVATITQNGGSDWDILEAAVTNVLETLVPSHDSGFEDALAGASAAKTAQDRALLPPDVVTIEEILDRTIRPGLQADGGDVEVLELEGNILTIRYQGACGGCPSSMMGTLQAIEGILRTEYNPYLEVVAL